MGVFAMFSSSKDAPSVPPPLPKVAQSPSPPANVNEVAAEAPQTETPAASDGPNDPQLIHTENPSVSTGRKSEDLSKPPAPRRLSFRSFAPTSKHKPALSEAHEREKKAGASNAFAKRWAKPLASNSDKRAKESALIVRTLIVGPPSMDYAASKVTRAVAKPQLSKVKSQLMQPTSANKVIAQLRALPVSGDTQDCGKETDSRTSGPIHAVCLAHPDAEEHALHFSKLTDAEEQSGEQLVPNVSSAPLNKLAAMFGQMRVVDLIATPDLGLGEPGDGKGLLAGAVPTAESVLNGFEAITPQLMALGYATGKAILPDHKGVHPPTDRMSVLTYWWGLEIVMPPPTLEYLSNTKSVAGTLVNFLTALSLVNNGVREILPFIRYISQFIDFEFNMIKGQDQGQGVVCASTWVMPAALVPRPWDFPPAEESVEDEAKLGQPGDKEGPDVAISPPVIVGSPSSVPLSTPSPNPLDTSSEPLEAQPDKETPSFPPSIPSAPSAAQPTTQTGVPSRLVPPIVMHGSQPVLRPGISLS